MLSYCARAEFTFPRSEGVMELRAWTVGMSGCKPAGNRGLKGLCG